MHADELEQALGRNIRATRIDRKLTQAELADRANLSLGAVKHLEGGKGSSTSTLVKVLRALGREDWLDGLAPPPEAFDPLAVLAAQQRSDATRGPRRVRARR